MSKLYLDIPYEHIEDLESYGCEFDEEREKWFYDGYKENYIKLGKFFMKRYEDGEIAESGILCDYLFILEGETICQHCGEKTKVINFGAINFIKYDSETDSINGIRQEINENEFHIINFNISDLPKYILDYLIETYNIQITETNFDEICEHCKTKVEYFSQCEENPFFLLFNPERVKDIKLFVIQLKEDVIVPSLDCNYWEDDYLFFENCEIKKIILD